MQHVQSGVGAPPEDDLLTKLYRQPLWLYCLIAAIYYALCEFRHDPLRLAASLGDSDDALRLTAVRDFLASGVWFDRTIERLGGSDPLVSHWSRFLDLALAAPLAFFSLFMPAVWAEMLVRALWPVAVLFVLLMFFARHANVRYGRTTAIIMIGLVAYGSAVTTQFGLGRIDHHNVMITLGCAGILFLAESFTVARMGWIAGLLLGLGTAVGLEALALTAASLGVAALLAAWSNKGLDGVSNASAGFAATLIGAMVLTSTPSQWFNIRCDEFSLNLILLAVAGASGVWAVATAGGALSRGSRIAVLAASGAAGIAAYALAEPQCLQGPYGQSDPAINAIWLNYVLDTSNYMAVIDLMPGLAFVTATMIAFGGWAIWMRVRKGFDETDLALCLLFVIATALTLWQIKFVPYAALISFPLLARAIAEIEATEKLSALARRLLAFFCVNQHSALALAALYASAMGMLGSEEMTAEEAFKIRDTCYSTANMSELGKYPKGRIAGHYDFGPFIVAESHHSAIAGPYHRLDKQLLAVHAIASASDQDAERQLRALGADYLLDCTELPPMPETPEQGLIPRLKAGALPAFLEPMPLSAGNPLRLWRIKPAGV